MMRLLQGRIVPVLLGCSLLAFGCKEEQKQASPTHRAAETQSAAEVTTVRAELREIGRTLVVTGSLVADERVVLSTQVEGRVQAMYVDLGTSLNEGDPIAQIDTADYRLRVEQASALLAQARARLGLDPAGTSNEVDIEQTSLVKEAQATFEEASANLERARALVERRLVARADFDTANAAYLRAQTGVENAREEIRNRLALLRQRRSEVELAKKQLADATIRAPFSGMVEARQASVGQYLSPGAPVATLVRINPLRLRVEVSEREAASVRVGQVVRFAIDGQELVFEGKVARIAPTLGEQSRTLVIEAEVQNEGALRPGAFTRAEIVLDGAAKALVVPKRSVVTFAGIDKVLVEDGGLVVEKRVVLGRRNDDFVEIISGLVEGDVLIEEPGNLQQGTPVVVRGR